MEYQRGLRTLKACLSADALGEFNVYEARLLENLRRERLYGSTETTRADRAAIVDGLNRLAQLHLGTSFNELCQSTAPCAGVSEHPGHGTWIDTGGGAVVFGDVTVEGGDFIGRDKAGDPEGDDSVRPGGGTAQDAGGATGETGQGEGAGEKPA